MGLPKKKLMSLPEFRTEDKVEKAAEGSEDDDEFHHEGREAHETKLDSGCYLFKGLLETRMNSLLV